MAYEPSLVDLSLVSSSRGHNCAAAAAHGRFALRFCSISVSARACLPRKQTRACEERESDTFRGVVCLDPPAPPIPRCEFDRRDWSNAAAKRSPTLLAFEFFSECLVGRSRGGGWPAFAQRPDFEPAKGRARARERDIGVGESRLLCFCAGQEQTQTPPPRAFSHYFVVHQAGRSLLVY